MINMYTVMARLAIMDKAFYDAQRQGRISFYMTSGVKALSMLVVPLASMTAT